MKKQLSIAVIAFFAVVWCVGNIAAQDAKAMKPDGMDMMAMEKSPQHFTMMAYKENELAFARALKEMSAGDTFEDVELARNAFAEIKRSMEKADEIHKLHMAKRSPEMTAKMKAKMDKMKPTMDVEKAAMAEHINALEKALLVEKPDVKEVQKHSAELVMKLEKMNKPAHKMDMPGKKPM